MSLKPRFLCTGIGSMPFENVEHAIEVSLSRVSESPFWPQLPQRSVLEQMEIQYSEGLPRAVVDKERQRLYFDTSGDYSDDLAEFYESYLIAMDPDEGTGDFSALAISSDYAIGLHAFKEHLQKTGLKLPFVKVQTTGPCTMGLSLVDENKRAIYYNEEFRDMLVKAMAMKCRWQIQQFRAFADKVICFIDEPILSAFGSSTYVSVKREDVVSALEEVISSIHEEDAISGIHCCGNTEWSIPIDAGVDIVNFDAFDYGESIAMYPDAVKSLLKRGGALAWGLTPTSPAIREQSAGALVERLEGLIDNLASKGIERQCILEQSILTPSCGTGTMAPEDAERVFELNQAVSLAMRDKCEFYTARQ